MLVDGNCIEYLQDAAVAVAIAVAMEGMLSTEDSLASYELGLEGEVDEMT